MTICRSLMRSLTSSVSSVRWIPLVRDRASTVKCGIGQGGAGAAAAPGSSSTAATSAAARYARGGIRRCPHQAESGGSGSDAGSTPNSITRGLLTALPYVEVRRWLGFIAQLLWPRGTGLARERPAQPCRTCGNRGRSEHGGGRGGEGGERLLHPPRRPVPRTHQIRHRTQLAEGGSGDRGRTRHSVPLHRLG